jgi:hypothetical protein
MMTMKTLQYGQAASQNHYSQGVFGSGGSGSSGPILWRGHKMPTSSMSSLPGTGNRYLRLPALMGSPLQAAWGSTYSSKRASTRTTGGSLSLHFPSQSSALNPHPKSSLNHQNRRFLKQIFWRSRCHEHPQNV